MGLARCELISKGIKLEFNSLQESLAIHAMNRRAEIEYLKIMAVVNAIIGAGNHIASAVTGSDSGGGDKLTKTLDALKELLLPQYKEANERKSAIAKKRLEKEVASGPIQVKVVGKKKHGR